ncbi:ABC-type glycerol-3-phosphate transport system, substrate-binding protein [Paenibacillus aquistagni]|uniref:ABC-type glycerol-3-phosphate transport system, substrate-binding protein n=2 Tax=Paenibacillus aquistagni TaxID=1852522 RepID=A0A1X7I5S9_9BACL|nr:ABC-type glycerol-3-phosphate transport system, substrate-binding protein [Paenibacillus aquistagni]
MYVDMPKRMNVILLISLVFILMLAGCSSTNSGIEAPKKQTQTEGSGTKTPVEQKTEEDEKDKEPVKLVFMAPWSKEQVESRFHEGTKEKFPHITIEPTGKFADAASFDELFAQNVMPDIILTTDGFDILKDRDMLLPLDDLLKERNFDFNKIRPGIMEALRARDPEGQGRLLGIPIEDVTVALHYNKAIFDKFGVDYPTDGMNWDEIVELAALVTGERDGIKYRGLATNSLSQAMTQLSANGTDPESGEPQFSKNQAFGKFFELAKRIASIPGNWEPDIQYDFIKGDVAMSLGLIANTIPHYPDELDYDVVSFPTWPDLPGIGPSTLPLTVAINKHSKHIDEALDVLEYLLSDEQQLRMHRLEVPSVSGDQSILEQFAADTLEKKGGRELNIKGIYSLQQAKPALYSPYGPDILLYGTNYVGSQVVPFLKSGDDVQTFLRKMDEDYATIVKERQLLN